MDDLHPEAKLSDEIPQSSYPSQVSRRTIFAKNICYALLFLLLLTYCYFFIYRTVKLATYRFSVEYNEGYVFVVADILSKGGEIYKPLDELPYVMPCYTPVFYLLSAFLMNLFGSSFAVGRILSTTASLVTGLVIFAESRRQARGMLLPLVAMLFFFSIPFVYVWAPLMRVDALALAFSVGGLYFFRSSNRYNLVISCVMFILALFTKQSMISAPAAVLLYLWLSGDRRKAANFFFGLLALGSAALFACILISGEDFLRHVFLYNKAEADWDHIYRLYGWLLQFLFVVIIANVWYSLSRVRKRQADLLILYFLVTGVSTLGIVKIGAYINYFYEFAAACCLMMTPTILGLKKYFEKIRKTNLMPLIPLLLSIQVIFMYHNPYSGKMEMLIPTPSSRYDYTKEKVIDHLRAITGPIIALDPELIVFSGGEVYIDAFFYNLMAAYGFWDESDFVRDLENRKFSSIVIPFDIVRPETASGKNEFFAERYFDARMKRAIIDNYRPSIRIREYHILVPRYQST